MLLHPTKWVLYTVPLVSFSALIFIFVANQEETAAAYFIFSMSAYSLTIVIASLPALAGRVRLLKAKLLGHRAIQKIWSTPLVKRYQNDELFRNSARIYQGMAINFFHMIFRMIAGIHYASVWFLSIAAYDMVLCVIRAYLVRSYRRRTKETPDYALHCYRRTAGMLFILNVPMGGMIILMIQTDSGFLYPGYIIYLSALYTLCMMTLSVIHLIKFQKMTDPILSAAKVLNFVCAMMSVLGLQTAMISRFSFQGESYRKMMNSITGGVVWIGVIVAAISMIICSTRKLKKVYADEQVRK